MYQAIDESHFDESIRSKFKKTIESVIIGNFSDFFENNEDKYKQLKAGGAISCGVNAMDINAFSTIIFNQKYVFFCHGFLIELSQLASEEERLSAILQMKKFICRIFLVCLKTTVVNLKKRTKTKNSARKKQRIKQNAICKLRDPMQKN